MKTWFALLVYFLFYGFLCPALAANRDQGSWKKSLHDKATSFNQQTAERHNILGSYPSSVRLLPPEHYVTRPGLPVDAGLQQGAWQQIVETGKLPPVWTFDHGTTGWSNVAHTSSWTGCLLILQHQGAFREEIGGAGYMTAYWMGRYHGFITEQQAQEKWWGD